jgi:predicted Zn-dependent protease
MIALTGCSSVSFPKFEQPNLVENKPATESSSASLRHDSPVLLLIKDQQFAAAETLLKNNIRRHPRQVAPSTNLGLLYANSDRKAEAEVVLQAVVRRHPDACAAQVRLGQLYRESFRFEAAETAYKTCLQYDVAYPAALLNLGILYELYRGSFDLALSHYERYQLAILEPDRNVQGWIADLSQRLATNNQLAEVIR